MSNANRMVPRPGGEPTGPKKLEEIRLPTEAEVKKGLLDTKVEPKNALSLSEFEVMKFIQEIQTKFSKILETKAGLLAELKEITEAKLKQIIDNKTFLQRLGSYFTEMTEVINNLVSEIEENEQIPQMLGVEAVKELIEEIQNSLYLDPEKNGDLINKLQSLPETSLENHIVRCQLALILDGGDKLKKFKERVQAALERSDDKEQLEKKQLEDLVKELKGLVREISALEIMQVFPSPSSPLPQEIEACKLRDEYDELKRSANYQAILILDGGNTLEQFRRRVQAALESNDEKELESLAQEISALKIMQVFPISSSRVLSEREAYELKAEYQRMIEMIKEAQRRLRKLGPST